MISNYKQVIKLFYFTGKIPVSILGDELWDTKCFPILDPTMDNYMNRQRKVNLTNQQFIVQRIMNVNPVFVNCKSFLFAFLSFLEMKQITNQINISIQRGTKKTRPDGKTEYSLQNAYSVLGKCKNTPS